jgi:putative protease
MSKPRILSPVASFQGAVEVIAAGADEIYCAVQMPGAVHVLNRPEYCCIPTYDELGRTATYARERGVETLVTLELPFISEFMAGQMREHISSCVDQGIDALIAGDIGLISLIRDMGPDTPVYASTLLVAMNYEAVGLMHELGVQRVILERHMSVEEISEVVQRNAGVDIEVFVHGQGCSNINVNCYLEFARASSDSIDGVIAGIKGMVVPCRLPFDVYRLGNGEQRMARAPILDAFTFCSLCRLPELIETGVMGLKIVGRCFPVEYQAKATRMYRELVDLVVRGQRTGFNRSQRRRFHKLVTSFQEEPFQPGSQNSDGSWSALESRRDVLCTQERCYYSPMFHAPYKASGAVPQG